MSDPLEFRMVTVAKDRYGGVYSGGKWLAFATCPERVPPQPWWDDVSAGTWEPDCPVGRGPTIEAALEDLRQQLKQETPVKGDR